MDLEIPFVGKSMKIVIINPPTYGMKLKKIKAQWNPPSLKRRTVIDMLGIMIEIKKIIIIPIAITTGIGTDGS